MKSIEIMADKLHQLGTQECETKCRAAFSVQVLSFLRFCVSFLRCSVPEPSKQVGDVFKCIKAVFCIEFAYGNG